jgi:peptidyl-prolyl cis-trans isomerase SurA
MRRSRFGASALAARAGLFEGKKQAALMLMIALFAAPVHAEIVNKILATVDGEPITVFELKHFAESSIRGRQLSTGSAGMDQSGLLDALITDKVIEKEVSDKGVIVRDEDIDRYIDAIKERNKLDDAKLKEALAAQGMSFDAYRLQIRQELEREQLVSREIRGKVSVPPEEVQRYYDAHLSEYSTPQRIQVAHIVFRLEPDAPADKVAALTAKADEVYGRIKKGADFAAMAKEYSEDPSGQNGGDLGWFKQGELLDTLETAAARMNVGDVSAPVRSKVGLHILKLEAREGASHQKLDELADQIKEQLYNAALEERFQKWLTEELRKRHNVEMH